MIYIFQTIFRILVVYVTSAFILGIIPVNTDFHEEPNGIRVYIISNGVHTDIVLPVHSNTISWSDFFNHSGFKGKFKGMNYIAFGWGNRLFYLNTPAWNDLTMSIAFKALFINKEPAMHVTLIRKIYEGEHVIPLKISEKQLNKITAYIKNSFRIDSYGEVIQIPTPGYGSLDLFFEATGKFSIIKSCNVWTNEGLKQTGIRCSVWSPLDKPIFYQLSHTGK